MWHHWSGFRVERWENPENSFAFLDQYLENYLLQVNVKSQSFIVVVTKNRTITTMRRRKNSSKFQNCMNSQTQQPTTASMTLKEMFSITHHPLSRLPTRAYIITRLDVIFRLFQCLFFTRHWTFLFTRVKKVVFTRLLLLWLTEVIV